MEKRDLEDLIEKGMSSKQIASETNRSPRSVSYWMRKYGIQSKYSGRTWNVAELKAAVYQSHNLRQTIEKLGLVPIGSNYQTIKRAIKENNLDTSHFKQIYRTFKNARPIEAYLVKDGPAITSSELKKRMFREGYFNEMKCSICQLKDTWNGKPIMMRLDHINGINDDNRVDNLRLVCPNCDSQLPTFCRGNPEKKPRPTCKCGKKVSKEGNHCMRCAQIERGKLHINEGGSAKIEWPTIERLVEMLEETGSYVALGKLLGVSDNAIRKRIRNHTQS